MGTTSAARAQQSDERAIKLPFYRRRAERHRANEQEVRILSITRADVPAPDNQTNEWETLGAEAMCTLHLPPADVAAAVDRDLSTSRYWLLSALGRAMDWE